MTKKKLLFSADFLSQTKSSFFQSFKIMHYCSYLEQPLVDDGNIKWGNSIGVGTFFRTIGVDNILPGIFATSFHLLLSIIFLLITSYALRRFSIQFPYCSLRGYTFTIANWRKNHELMSGPRRPPPPRHCCHRLFSSKHR